MSKSNSKLLSSKEIDEQDPTPIAQSWVKDSGRILSPSDVSKLSSQRSDLQGVFQLLFHATAVALCCFVIQISTPRSETSWIHFISASLAYVALAFVVSFLFMPLHECVHETAFKSKWFNVLVAYLAGFLTFRPAAHYTYYHWAHHKYTGSVEKDPELQNTLIDPDLSNMIGYLVHLSGVPFWIDRLITIVRHVFGWILDAEFYLQSERAKLKVINEARIFSVIYLGLLVVSFKQPSFGSLLFRLWIIPSLLGQVHLRFYLLAEHKGCIESPNIFENTRTTLSTRLYTKLAWNMPYHSEHHAWPGVPFHKLEELNCKINEKLGEKRPKCMPLGDFGYVNLHSEFVNELLSREKREMKLSASEQKSMKKSA